MRQNPARVMHVLTEVITGLAIKGSHGLEFIKDLQVRYPDLRMLVFSMYDESVYAERAIRAGACGFITKREPTEEALRAIYQVLNGHIYLSPRLMTKTVQRTLAPASSEPASGLERLSDREVEVLELIGQGRSSREIATALHLSLKTIETYRSRIRVKLKLQSAADLIRHAQGPLEQMGSG